MTIVSSLRPDCRGLVCPIIGAIHPKVQSHIRCQNWRRDKSRNGMQLPFGRCWNGKVQHVLGKRYTLSGGGNHHLLTVDVDYDQEPFWSNLMKQAFWAMKSLLIFLVEQPSQLKHIEWPSFQNTISEDSSLGNANATRYLDQNAAFRHQAIQYLLN